MTDASLLSYPKPDAPTNIMTDASNTAVGAVLQQHINDTWTPIVFFSRTLKPAETRYSTFDRELLAVYLAIKHFRHFIEGRQFHIYTDHKPLIYALNSNSDKYTPRQLRHLDFISQFTSDIRHVSGTDNCVADALSRIEANSLHQSTPVVIDSKPLLKLNKLIQKPLSYSQHQLHFNYNHSQYQHPTLHCYVTCLLVFLVLMYHNNLERLSLTPYIHSHTQIFVPPNA